MSQVWAIAEMRLRRVISTLLCRRERLPSNTVSNEDRRLGGRVLANTVRRVKKMQTEMKAEIILGIPPPLNGTLLCKLVAPQPR